jgi:hypothetical protein
VIVLQQAIERMAAGEAAADPATQQRFRLHGGQAVKQGKGGCGGGLGGGWRHRLLRGWRWRSFARTVAEPIWQIQPSSGSASPDRRTHRGPPNSDGGPIRVSGRDIFIHINPIQVNLCVGPDQSRHRQLRLEKAHASTDK